MTQAPPARPPSPRTRLRRLHEKAAYDFPTIAAVLDAQPVAHVAHLVDGAPCVMPTLHWREGARIYWHGSSASRMMKAARGAPVCVSVSTLEGLVLARSGLEHSVLFRSVMIFGTAEPVEGAEKARQLEAMIEGMFPGRWPQLRPMTAQEMKATMVLSLPVTEASAKLGLSGPADPPADRTWPVWAGTVPIARVLGTPVPDGPAQGPIPIIRRF
jgi:hypothetical protein